MASEILIPPGVGYAESSSFTLASGDIVTVIMYGAGADRAQVLLQMEGPDGEWYGVDGLSQPDKPCGVLYGPGTWRVVRPETSGHCGAAYDPGL